LEIVKTSTPAQVAAGGAITYTLAITNTGPYNLSAASAITVTDQLPVGVSGSVANAGDWNCGQVGQVVTCTRLGLALGSAPDIVITGSAPTSLGPFDNTATVATSATDPNNANDSSQATIIVNTAPAVNAGPDKTATEGELISFAGSYIDPDPQPPGAIAWDFGDGFGASGVLTPTHAYQDNGMYTATLTITDTLGGWGQDTLVVNVTNVTPTLGMAAITQTIYAGQAVTLTGTITDPGVLDNQTVLIEWTPTVSQTLNLPIGTSSFSAMHAYTLEGVYLVTVTVTDKDGASTSQSGTVTVLPAERKVFLPLTLKGYSPGG
jgi:uncharacterized repeat protein (TIGR01451 family)